MSNGIQMKTRNLNVPAQGVYVLSSGIVPKAKKKVIIPNVTFKREENRKRNTNFLSERRS